MGTRYAQDYLLGGHAEFDDPDDIDHDGFARLTAEKGEMEAFGFDASAEATNRTWTDWASSIFLFFDRLITV
jgi:hypothetical protein